MSETLIYVASPELDNRFEQALSYLQEARYKQAVNILNNLLQESLSLIDRLHVLAQRALAYALWKKWEAAVDDASMILSSVSADTEHLSQIEIDWEYEKNQDIGHLSFLAEVYQLRGVVHRLCKEPRRAVEDFSLSLYMNSEQNPLIYLHRASALIELNECLERAFEDLEFAFQSEEERVREYFHFPRESSGHFQLEHGEISFQAGKRKIALTPDKVTLKKNQVQADLFELSRRFGLLD